MHTWRQRPGHRRQLQHSPCKQATAQGDRSPARVREKHLPASMRSTYTHAAATPRAIEQKLWLHPRRPASATRARALRPLPRGPASTSGSLHHLQLALRLPRPPRPSLARPLADTASTGFARCGHRRLSPPTRPARPLRGTYSSGLCSPRSPPTLPRATAPRPATAAPRLAAPSAPLQLQLSAPLEATTAPRPRACHVRPAAKHQRPPRQLHRRDQASCTLGPRHRPRPLPTVEREKGKRENGPGWRSGRVKKKR
jgi:hypothetical protein